MVGAENYDCCGLPQPRHEPVFLLTLPDSFEPLRLSCRRRSARPVPVGIRRRRTA